MDDQIQAALLNTKKLLIVKIKMTDYSKYQ